MLWSSKFPQDADFGSWKDDDYPKTPDGWNGQSLGTVVVLWPKRSPEVEQRARKVLGKATASAQNVFDEALTSARKVYDEAVASAGKVRDKATAPARKVYGEGTALAWKVFSEARTSARKAYVEATASAQNVFDEALTSARKAYVEATAPARKAYVEAKAPAEKAFDKAVAPVQKAHEEAEASAWKAYEEAVALAGIDYNLILAENLPLLLDPPPSRIVLYRADTDKWVETPDPQEASRFASLAVWEHQKFVEKLIGGQKEVRKAFEGGEPMRFGRRRSVFVKSYTRRRRALF